MTILRRRSVLVGAAAATLGAPSLARAQADWPKGAIKIIVPFPPGGISDMILQFGQQISGALGIPLVRLFGQHTNSKSVGDCAQGTVGGLACADGGDGWG